MLGFVLRKIMGTQNERALKKFAHPVEEINSLESAMKGLSDNDLSSKTGEFRKRIAEGAELDVILPEVFAVVREVARRTINMRHFDVQLMGGIVLHQGTIAEMATGEGKTLVATLPVYLNALTGKGVHVITVNDYLAKRDMEWMGPVYEFLGMSVGAIQHSMSPEARQEAYGCDITYGTNNEFGFDYLRDNMVVSKEHMVQKPLNYAIVDEVDSILVDEARTPLIISGPAEESTDKYYIIDKVVRKLKGRVVLERDEIDAKYKGIDLSEGYDFIVDEKTHAASLTEDGIVRCEKLLNISDLYDDIGGQWVHHIRQALIAHNIYKRDVDYMVRDGEVLIVDEFTGRLMPGRRWSDGLHQAVEAKENVKIERENQTLATVTFQNYFKMYNKLAGMTGTAATEANEFKQIYKLDVVVMPTNKPLHRENFPDVIYRTQREKFNAIVSEIAELNKLGRPILVGTISIAKSELLSSMLKKGGIPHNVLNAKYHEQEAHIVAQAGHLGAVTIATNMAGRGTDILLGGNPKFLSDDMIRQISMRNELSEEERARIADDFIKKTAEDHNKVVELGGLHIIGTERHEARRIDNQLRGRAGRQGDPGSSRFYIALEDDLMRVFGSERIISVMTKLGMEEGQDIQHPLVSRAIENAQRRVEGHNFEIRKHLLEYDNVMNKQREVIYAERRRILEGENLKEYMFEIVEELLDEKIEVYFSKDISEEEWDVVGFQSWICDKLSIRSLTPPFSKGGMGGISSREEIKEKMLKEIKASYNQKEQELGSEIIRDLERAIMLQMIDSKWKDHLYAMDSLKEGIGLRAYAQRNPLIEYQQEGYDMFMNMIERVKEDTIEMLFKVRMAIEPSRSMGVFESLPQELVHRTTGMFEGSPQEASPIPQRRVVPQSTQTYHRDTPKTGRNEPCPCGSGKKYKRCCGG